MRLDELDLGILRLLRGDARLSYRRIATQLGSTTPTVSARVRRLEQLGVIRGYRAELHPSLDADAAPTRPRAPRLPRAVDIPCHQCRGPIVGEPFERTLGGMAHVFCCAHCRETFMERFEKLAR